MAGVGRSRRDGAPASTPVHGAGAASDFYGECSSLVSVPKVVSAIDSFNFVLATKGKSNYRGYDQNPAIQNSIFIFSLIILM